MFTRASVRREATDIAALLAAADPAGGRMDASAATRLADIQHRITGGRPGPGGRAARKARAWWPDRAERQRRRRIAIIFVAVPALIAATAAGWVIATSQPASRLAANIWCFGSARGVSDQAVVPATGQAPTAVCAQLWAAGQLIPGRHSVPRLVACSLRYRDGGSIGVFPDTTCAAEHLPPLPPGYAAAARQFLALEKSLNADGVNPQEWLSGRFRCVSRAAGIADANRALQQTGFTGWHIVVGKFRPSAPCADVEPTSATHSVSVTGAPRPPSSP